MAIGHGRHLQVSAAKKQTASNVGLEKHHRYLSYSHPEPPDKQPLLLQIGQLISDAMDRVGRQGVVTMEESRTAEDHLYVVEGMQFDRGYISPYFVTDPERMVSPPYPGL